ncbi:MAG: carboxymuconolactone decarboxylase family protein [Desulfobacteraceae bacterium]|nr:carboxymuconolactone decarboxylase family protein [Desulfobacteraceae bacterium]
MESRKKLKDTGRRTCRELGLAEGIHGELAPGYRDLIEELAFGAIWSRKGLGYTDRMIATLSILSALERHGLLPAYIQAAIELGLSARTVQEVFIHAGLYAGFPTTESALRIAARVFDERGIKVLAPKTPEVEFEELDRIGRTLMNTLHSTRSKQGYASPDHATTADLYNLAIRYGYGSLWQRPDLDRRQRLICALATFTALDNHVQLGKFVPSAMEVDLTHEEIVEVLMQTAPYSGFTRALNALVIAGEAMS